MELCGAFLHYVYAFQYTTGQLRKESRL